MNRNVTVATGNKEDITVLQPIGLLATRKKGTEQCPPLNALLRINVLDLDNRDITTSRVINRATERIARTRLCHFAQSSHLYCIISHAAY
jgi:hypothetical protein